MNQEQVIALAREAGFKMGTAWYGNTKVLERFAVLVAEATKEKAAKVCERVDTDAFGKERPTPEDCAAAIRSMK